MFLKITHHVFRDRDRQLLANRTAVSNRWRASQAAPSRKVPVWSSASRGLGIDRTEATEPNDRTVRRRDPPGRGPKWSHCKNELTRVDPTPPNPAAKSGQFKGKIGQHSNSAHSGRQHRARDKATHERARTVKRVLGSTERTFSPSNHASVLSNNTVGTSTSRLETARLDEHLIENSA